MKKKILTNMCFSFIGMALLVALPERGRGAEAQPDTIGNHRVEGIDVVQPRVFTKGGRHELSLGVGFIDSNDWVFYSTVPIQYTYHFRETLAFEVLYMHAFGSLKSIVDDLANIPCPSANSDIDGDGVPDTNCGVQLEDGVEAYRNFYFGNVVWSPIYGKFSIFSKRISHFDIYLLAGAGMIDTEIIRTDLPGDPTENGANRFAFSIGIGGKIFINDWFAVKLDFRNFTVRQGLPFNQIVNDRMISLGTSFFLPPHPAK